MKGDIVRKPGGQPRWTDADAAHVDARRAAGETWDEIGAVFNIPGHVARKRGLRRGMCKHVVRAVGFKHCNKIRTAVAFDPDVFNDIVKLATTERTTFAEQVRLLVEFGMESLNA